MHGEAGAQVEFVIVAPEAVISLALRGTRHACVGIIVPEKSYFRLGFSKLNTMKFFIQTAITS